MDQKTDETAGTPVAELSFEEALAELERVVDALEGGDVPLERSIDLYERGEALREVCEKRLRDAQMRVDRIVAGPDGNATGTVPLDGQSESQARGRPDQSADRSAGRSAGQSAGQSVHKPGSDDDVPF